MTETREIVLRLQLEYPPGLATGPVVSAAADEPVLYRVPEAARLLAVGESVVTELIARGEIESVKIGRARRITRSGIDTYVRLAGWAGGRRRCHLETRRAAGQEPPHATRPPPHRRQAKGLLAPEYGRSPAPGWPQPAGPATRR